MNIETYEILVAGTLIGQAQESLRRALEMAERGTGRERERIHTRAAISAASRAANIAQQAVNAEVVVVG
jgi:hypothetical protein